MLWHRRAGHDACCGMSCRPLQVPHALSQTPLCFVKLRTSTCVPNAQHSQRLWLRAVGNSSPTAISPGIRTHAHRTAISLQQRHTLANDHGGQSHNNSSHGGQVQNNSSSHGGHHHRRLRNDDSLKIIMLLSLSLTLLLLPWVAHHPEFLIAPLLLAVTPVVGNGVRPVLKEVAAGFIATLRLMGMAAWFDITHELPPQHQQHHTASNGDYSSSGIASAGSRQAPQQHQQHLSGTGQMQMRQQQQQQQPRPSGPYSSWPNPAYWPQDWPAPPQPGRTTAGPSPGVDADVDWTPGAPPDPHRGDPVSLQHLQQVLAADLQTESELGRRQQQLQGGMAAGQSIRSRSSYRDQAVPLQHTSPPGSPPDGRSPAGSMSSMSSVSSFDGADFAPRQQQQQQLPLLPPQEQQQVKQQQQQQQQQHSRDPRVLSKEAKQQLYQHHHSHTHTPAQQHSKAAPADGTRGTS